MPNQGDREGDSGSRAGQIGLYTVGSLISAVALGAVPFLRRYSGAPYVASSQAAREALSAFLVSHRKSFSRSSLPRLTDLGSGSGEIVLDAAAAGYNARGFELNLWLVLRARLAARTLPNDLRSLVLFERRDFWKCTLDKEDVVVVFGVPDIMEKIGKKAMKECKDGCIVCSNTFEIPGWKPMRKANGVLLYRVEEQREEGS